jgi:malonyl-CoA/methylmalonyl-CoA synthetase
VTAIVVLRDGAVLGEADLLSALGERIARYKLPRRVLFAHKLPRNAMGKVMKNVLREVHRSLYARAASGRPS